MGKPQCHIVARAKNRNVVAARAGCALSRSRTGMQSEGMTWAIPGKRPPDVVATLEATAGLDRVMARYASADAKRWWPGSPHCCQRAPKPLAERR